jgi:ribosomal protein S18 acetylase RimI-like enzyme
MGRLSTRQCEPLVRSTDMRIRPAAPTDKAFILDLARRLTEFGTVPGRDTTQMVARDRQVLATVLEQPPADTALFIAEDADGNPAGFMHLTTDNDYYSDSTTGHIADVVVVPGADGRGIGSALIAFAEVWARERGFAMLTLNVFTENRRARRLYEKAGFQEEWIRCTKRL